MSVHDCMHIKPEEINVSLYTISMLNLLTMHILYELFITPKPLLMYLVSILLLMEIQLYSLFLFVTHRSQYISNSS